MVRLIDGAVSVGVRKTSFNAQDGSTVHGAMIFFTYPLPLSDQNTGDGVGQVYVSAEWMRKENFCVGDPLTLARTKSGFEIVM